MQLIQLELQFQMEMMLNKATNIVAVVILSIAVP